MTTFFTNYAIGPFTTDTFACNVDPCTFVVGSYAAVSPIADQIYGVGTTTLNIPFPSYVGTPNCVYTMTKEVGVDAVAPTNLALTGFMSQDGSSDMNVYT